MYFARSSCYRKRAKSAFRISSNPTKALFFFSLKNAIPCARGPERNGAYLRESGALGIPLLFRSEPPFVKVSFLLGSVGEECWVSFQMINGILPGSLPAPPLQFVSATTWETRTPLCRPKRLFQEKINPSERCQVRVGGIVFQLLTASL